jgi:hypothetical protein
MKFYYHKRAAHNKHIISERLVHIRTECTIAYINYIKDVRNEDYEDIYTHI